MAHVYMKNNFWYKAESVKNDFFSENVQKLDIILKVLWMLIKEFVWGPKN